MAKTILLLLLTALVIVVWRAWPRPKGELPMVDFQALTGPDRVARARLASEERLTEKFRAAAVPYPSSEIFFRWLKREAVLELWARNDAGPFRHVADYPILSSSGRPGPKRKEGDKQVPEGFYIIDRFNPESLYHLSLGLNYPNDADRVHADPEQPGSDIFIHGSDGSSGCAPLGDPAIEEVYLAALGAQTRGQTKIAVHIFPARMTGPEWPAWAEANTQADPGLAEFWAQLQPAYEFFELHRQLPTVTVTNDGLYKLAAPGR